MKFTNLTPHTINILNEEKEQIKSIPSTGLARCSVSKQAVAEFDDVVLYRTIFGEVKGLPEYNKNIINIVSLLVREACPERIDLFSPGELVRGESGQPIGCIGLTR